MPFWGKIVESAGTFGREEVDEETGGGGLLLIGGKNGAGVLEERGPCGKEESLGMGAPSSTT